MTDKTPSSNDFDQRLKLAPADGALAHFVSDLNRPAATDMPVRPLKAPVDLLAEAVKEAPHKAVQNIAHDLESDKSHVAWQVASGAALGAGFTAVLKFAPRAGYIGAALLGAKALYDVGNGTESFLSRAGQAKDGRTQGLLVEQASSAIGSNLAAATESLPGAFAGGFAATRLVGVPKLYADAGSAIVDPIKNRLAFMGPGVKTLPAELSRAEAVDAHMLARLMQSEHPWSGVESGSTVDLASMRMSRKVSGSETGLSHLPASEKADTLTVHTHKPERLSYPGRDDVIATPNLGMVLSGPETSIYIGQRQELTTMMRQGRENEFVPQLRSITFNDADRTARRLIGSWDKARGGWTVDDMTALDYGKTIEALQNLDKSGSRAWNALSALPAHIQ